MSATMSVSRVRAQRLMEERNTLNKLHEDLLSKAETETRDLNDAEKLQITGYRERQDEIDVELTELEDVFTKEEQSASVQAQVRAHLLGHGQGMTLTNGEPQYKTFAAYARDKIISDNPRIAALAGGERARTDARERLMRSPEHTLSGDLEGLIPPQFMLEIMDVINSSRPVITSARQVSLNRGELKYPKITSRPIVDLQGTSGGTADEKSEGGAGTMTVDMQGTTATSFIGGGNLSWQAVNWSTPDALTLWFDLAAADYALKTETFAAGLLESGPGTVNDPIAGTSDFQQWVTAIVEGVGDVYDNSQADADTLYLSSDMFVALAALVSNQAANFISTGAVNLAAGTGTVAGLNVVRSRGFTSGTAIVGDSRALIVAESPGAPVELRVVEPAIGGYEVGLIGALAVAVFDVNRFQSLV